MIRICFIIQKQFSSIFGFKTLSSNHNFSSNKHALLNKKQVSINRDKFSLTVKSVKYLKFDDSEILNKNKLLTSIIIFHSLSKQKH